MRTEVPVIYLAAGDIMIAATAANAGLGSKAALPDISTTDPFEAFKAATPAPSNGVRHEI